MARKKSKYCKGCDIKFMGNHVCTGLNRKVLYDDPVMVSLSKAVAKGPDQQLELDLPEPASDNNSGTT